MAIGKYSVLFRYPIQVFLTVKLAALDSKPVPHKILPGFGKERERKNTEPARFTRPSTLG